MNYEQIWNAAYQSEWAKGFERLTISEQRRVMSGPESSIEAKIIADRAWRAADSAVSNHRATRLVHG